MHDQLPAEYALHRYRVLKPLGRGGFGCTYLVTDETLGGTFALKEYFPRGLSARLHNGHIEPLDGHGETFEWGLRRFTDEARLLRSLSHPHVVAVKDYFTLNGTAYLAMDYCPGRDLDATVPPSTPLSLNALLRLLGPLLNALSYVHGMNLIHRDIKPSNIILRAIDDPVLLDFGSARHAVRDKTQVLTAVLTRGYAPIEQYSSSGHFGPWTDLYGLGATLYRLITGKAPIDSASRMMSDDLQRDLGELERTPYAPLLPALRGALAVKPDERPQSVAEFRESLNPLFDYLLSEQSQCHRTKDHERGLELAGIVRSVFGDSALNWSNEGIFLSDLGRYRESLDAFERALEQTPRWVNAWCNKGRTLRAMGRHAEALACYDTAIECDPQAVTPLMNRASALVQLGRLREAKDCYKRCLVIDPENSEAEGALSRLGRYQD